MIVITGGCSQKSTSSKKLSKVFVNMLPSSYQLHFSQFRRYYVNNMLMAEVLVENLSDQAYNDLVYCFKWYDNRYHEVGKDFSIWEPLFLNARDTKEIKVLAPVPAAKRYKFLIRQQGK
jgi:uncharacterized protein YcfL